MNSTEGTFDSNGVSADQQRGLRYLHQQPPLLMDSPIYTLRRVKDNLHPASFVYGQPQPTTAQRGPSYLPEQPILLMDSPSQPLHGEDLDIYLSSLLCSWTAPAIHSIERI